MTDEQLGSLLHTAIEAALAAKYRTIALVQMVVEAGVLKGKEDEVLKMLDQRAMDLRQNDETEFNIKERVRTLREAWSKVPKQ